MPRDLPIRLAFYTKSDCPLCATARFALERIRARLRDVPLVVEVRDIETNADWFDTYRYRIPVVELDGDVLAEMRFDESALKRRLREAFRERVRDAVSPEIGQ